MRNRSTLTNVAVFLCGVSVGWLILALIRSQLLAFLATKPIEANRFAVLSGIYLIELIVLVSWVAGRNLPGLLKLERVPALKKTVLQGVSQAAVIAAISTMLAIVVYSLVAPSDGESSREFTMTKVLLPEASEQHFFPIRSAEVDRNVRSSGRARAAVDAAVLAQLLTGVLLHLQRGTLQHQRPPASLCPNQLHEQIPAFASPFSPEGVITQS
ncbi:MAG: hypothetical protein AAF394_13565, partial [Planctomycetota bacterium]